MPNLNDARKTIQETRKKKKRTRGGRGSWGGTHVGIELADEAR